MANGSDDNHREFNATAGYYDNETNFTSKTPVGENNNYNEMMSLVTQLNTVAYSYVMPLFLASGICTNLLNMYVLHDLGKTKNKKLRGAMTTYMYLNWLSLAQLLACLSVIPSLINLYRHNLSYSWAFYYAHFEIFLMNSLTSTCVYIVVGLSFDRFVAVCRPHSYNIINGVRWANIRIIASYVIPPIIYLPMCFFQRVALNEEESGYTTVNNDVVNKISILQKWDIAVEFCHRLLPATLVVILNICIIVKFKEIKSSVGGSRKEENTEDCNNQGSRQVNVANSSRGKSCEQERRMFLLLMGVIVVFLVTTLPSACLGLTDTYGHGFQSFGYEVFRAAANLLEILGFSLNFFLYFFLVPEVRKKLPTASCTQDPNPTTK